MVEPSTTSSPQDQPLICIEEAKALAKLLRSRGYFHRGTVPWTSQDASFLHTKPAVELDPQKLWIVETTTGLCSVERVRQEFEEFLKTRHRCMVSEATEHLGIDDATLQQQVLRHDSSTRKYYAFGAEIVLRTYLEEAVEKLLGDIANDDERIHIVTELIDSKLHVPFEPAFALIQENLNQFATLRLRRLDKGAWAVVTEAYLASLSRNLLDQLSAHRDGPKSLKDFAKELGWQVSWVQEAIKEDEGRFQHLGDFGGDIFTPIVYTREQKKNVLDLYSVNGFVGSHICQATFGVTTAMMKQYLSDVEGTLVLSQCVVNPNAVVEPLGEAIKECIASSSWLNLGPFIPLELLEHHRDDVEELLATIQSTPDIYKIWIENSSALMFSRKFIELFHEEAMPDIVQRAAKQKAKQLQKETESRPSATTGSGVLKSGKEKHREREAAKGNTETQEINCGQLSFLHILSALKTRYPTIEEVEDEEILLKACAESFCTSEVNEKYSNAVLSIIDGLEKRKHALCDLDNEAIASFESSFVNLCHLIQARKKFLDHAVSSCSPAIIDGLRRSLLQTTCRELVLRMTHNALLKANSDLSEFDLSQKLSNVDLASAVPVDAGSFISPEGSVNEKALIRSRELLSSSVVSLLIKLWKAIDISRESNAEPQLGDFMEAANDLCLPISGMPFTKLDKKAEKRLLGIRAKYLQAHLFRAKTLAQAIDFSIALLYQQVKGYVVFTDSASRDEIVALLLNERKFPKEKQKTLERALTTLQGLGNSDENDLIEALKELNTT